MYVKCCYLLGLPVFRFTSKFQYYYVITFRKRDERLRKVVEARVKEEQKEEEKKKKIEQKMAQIDEKNDKVSIGLGLTVIK